MKKTGTSPEFKTFVSRNDMIREALADGKVPMLAFEQQLLEIELLGHTATQNELGVLLGEAMSESSETWHDNAPAEAVAQRSHILVDQASKVIAALRNRLIIPYEQDEKDKVSIGALVHITLAGQPETVFMTGKQRRLPDDVAAVISEDTMPVNIQSPLGAAIFDTCAGAETSYRVNGRDFAVTVVSVEYPAIIPTES